MIFKNRQEAGAKLASVLVSYKDKDAIIVALPRGGVVLGREIADSLGLPLDLVVPRKIGAEFDEEYAIGAITEEGDVVWNEKERAAASVEYIKRAVVRERAEAKRRLHVYREGLGTRDFKNKIVIIVDDGIATGLTMRAAILTVMAGGPKKIIVAVPVSSPEAVAEIKKEVDEMVVLAAPEFLGSIGQFYEDFPQVEDRIVISLMKKI